MIPGHEVRGTMIMAFDRDVAAAAVLLVARYGDRARLRAARRAARLRAPHDDGARAVWAEVLHATDELQRQPPHGCEAASQA